MTTFELAAAPLQGLLAVSRLERSGADLPSVLDAIARIVSESFGFGLVAVSVHRPAWDDFEVAAVHGGDEARRALLGQTLARGYWEPLLDPRFEHRGAQVVPKAARDWSSDDGTWFVPGPPAGDWDPADAFFVPLRHGDGDLLGILSVNEPLHGRRPSDEEVDLLVAVAAHASHAIESALHAAENARHRRALEHLFRVSSELRGASADSMLDLVCDGIRDALGFELAVVELADRERDRYVPAASAGVELTHEDIRLDCPLERFDAAFHADFEVEGCYLLPNAQAHALVGGAAAPFESSRNGAGELAWDRHWLLVPLEDGRGERIGFIWADNPSDRLLPSRERLQALRLFADQAALALQSAEQIDRLRDALALQRGLLESSPLAIVAVDRDNRAMTWNPAAEELFGWTADEVLGRELPYVDEADREDVDLVLHRLLAGGTPVQYEARRYRQDGRPIDVSVSAAPLRDAAGTTIGVMAMCLDLTARKRTEADLARRNAELEALHATTLELVEELDPENVLHSIVAKACELLGTVNGGLYLVDPDGSALEMRTGVGLFSSFVGTRLARGEGLSGRVWESGTTQVVDDYSFWDDRAEAYDEERLGAVCCIPLRVGADVVGVFGVSLTESERTFSRADIGLLERFAQLASLALENARLYEAARRELEERRQAETALDKSQELQRTVLENANDLIALFDASGRLLYASPSHKEVLGWEHDELVGVSTADQSHPEDRPASDEALRTVLAEGSSSYALRIRHKDGHHVPVEGTMKAVPGDDGRPRMLLSTARDVTEQRRHEEARAALEEQLHQAQKMEAVGRLAGGIAHDFNNLLTAIAGYGDFALLKLPADSDARGDVEEIRLAADRAAALTRQLLAFSRRQVLQPKVLDLNEVVVSMESMLRRVLGEDVVLATTLASDLGRTRADRGQLEQVLMNLAINARDAMPRGGRLVLSTRNVEIDEAFGETHVGAVQGSYVLLTVTDTGEGMGRETLDRIFEPFFTTKPQGKGTGLGLSTVYGIVKQTGGHIWADSEVGRGTVFTVFLPRVDEPLEPPDDRPQPTARAAGETVLLVEDETIVRELVEEMLANAGYRVLVAGDGEEALAVAGAHRGGIDVLLTDVVMPGLSGREVADALLRERPSLRVVFTSGYTEDAISGHGALGDGTAFLEKPFDAAQLGAALRAALEA